EQVAVVDRAVLRIERLAIPPRFEDAFGDATLVAGVLVDRACALCGPGRDLDREAFGLVHQPAVALQALFGGEHHRRLVDAPHAGGRNVREFGRVDVHAVPRDKCPEGSQAFATIRLQAQLYLAISSRPTWSRWTSSGPSASLSVRWWAYMLASLKTW